MNCGTAYGKDFNLSSIRSPEDLVHQHPLTTYIHYENYTERVATGEKNVMTKADILLAALSAGTTGKAKMYPYTRAHSKRFFFALLATLYHNYVIFCKPGLQRVFQFRLFNPLVVNEHGVRMGGAGNIVCRPLPCNITPIAFLKASAEGPSFYIQAAFALAERELGILDGYSSDVWYLFFKYIVTNKKQLCDAIETGELSPFPGLGDDLRIEINQHLQPDPGKTFR